MVLWSRKMNFIKFFIIPCCFLVNTFVFSEQVFTDKDRQNFKEGAYKGCLEKQDGSSINKFLKSGVVEEYCNCYSQNATDEIFQDINFQIAFSRKDTATVKRIIDKLKLPSTTIKFSNSCMSELELKYGGNNKLFEKSGGGDLSKKIGLTGEDRRSFLVGGIDTCMSSNKNMSDINAKNYCTCALNSLADNLSTRDVYELSIDSQSIKNKITTLNKKAVDKCLIKIK